MPGQQPKHPHSVLSQPPTLIIGSSFGTSCGVCGQPAPWGPVARILLFGQHPKHPQSVLWHPPTTTFDPLGIGLISCFGGGG
jgi:hypothetical protein